MFGLNERDAARKSPVQENWREFLPIGISLLYPTEYVFFSSKFCVFTNTIDNFSINAKLFL